MNIELGHYPRNAQAGEFRKHDFWSPSVQDMDVIESLMRCNKKISAIKYVRTTVSDVFSKSYGNERSIDLKSAKECVEMISDANPDWGIPVYPSIKEQVSDVYIVIGYNKSGHGRVATSFFGIDRCKEFIRDQGDCDMYVIAKQVTVFSKKWSEG